MHWIGREILQDEKYRGSDEQLSHCTESEDRRDKTLRSRSSRSVALYKLKKRFD